MDRESFTEVATTTLANKPWIGLGATGGGSAITLMDLVTPYFEFAILMMSFAIGAITLWGQFNKHILKNG
jgi:hypothetical protein